MDRFAAKVGRVMQAVIGTAMTSSEAKRQDADAVIQYYERA